MSESESHVPHFQQQDMASCKPSMKRRRATTELLRGSNNRALSAFKRSIQWSCVAAVEGRVCVAAEGRICIADELRIWVADEGRIRGLTSSRLREAVPGRLQLDESAAWKAAFHARSSPVPADGRSSVCVCAVTWRGSAACRRPLLTGENGPDGAADRSGSLDVPPIIAASGPQVRAVCQDQISAVRPYPATHT
jgi:hypothetical protein